MPQDRQITSSEWDDWAEAVEDYAQIHLPTRPRKPVQQPGPNDLVWADGTDAYGNLVHKLHRESWGHIEAAERSRLIRLAPNLLETARELLDAWPNDDKGFDSALTKFANIVDQFTT